jgi:hypothetical protein
MKRPLIGINAKEACGAHFVMVEDLNHFLCEQSIGEHPHPWDADC